MECTRDLELRLFEFILVKHFSGIARILLFQKGNEKTIFDKVSINDDNIMMLLQYYSINDERQLIPADVSKINDSNFISILEYKNHIPVAIENNRMSIENEFIHFVKIPSNFGPKFGKSHLPKKDEDEDYEADSGGRGKRKHEIDTPQRQEKKQKK